MDTLNILDRHHTGSFHLNEVPEGLAILIDKPTDWTSFDVVAKVRGELCRALQQKKLKVGHAGTLDPMATGLLILCTGKYTKRLESFQAQHKVYTGTFRLGATTDSYDRETPEKNHQTASHLTEDQIRQAMQDLTGEMDQVPPAYSARKVQGKRAYALARKGQEVRLESRPVTISSFALIGKEGPDITFQVACSKGTYIRSLAHDLGQNLGCGAYLRALRREQNGPYQVANALSMPELIAWIRSQPIAVNESP